MRIQIVQTEMEQAIKDFVLGQLNVNEGMDITVELRAGRGEDGFTADINIVPSQTKKQGTVKRSTTPAEKPKVEVTREPEESSQEAPVTEETNITEPVEEDTQVEEVVEDKPRPAGSLFSGLKRPSNS